MQRLKLEYLPTSKLSRFENNARTHSDSQIEQIAASIREFGFTNPILVDETSEIVAGHGRLSAALLLGLDNVPVIRLTHLSERQRRAYILADNKLAMNAGWDFEKLSQELSYLAESEYDLTLTGFLEDELDALLKSDESLLPEGFAAGEKIVVSEHERNVGTVGKIPDDQTPKVDEKPVSRLGDVFVLGDHRVMCGSALSADDVVVLMMGKKADMVFTDPPYNVKISGLGSAAAENSVGKIHGEFAMASGEMTQEEFTGFLHKSMSNLVANSKDGAIHYVCMDWRHMMEVLQASEAYKGEAVVKATDRLE